MIKLKTIAKRVNGRILANTFSILGHIIGFVFVVMLVSFAYYIVMPNQSDVGLGAYQSIIDSYDNKLKKVDDFLEKLSLQDEIISLEKELYSINNENQTLTDSKAK
ncbi:hypothetical protein LS74_000170 [Helicobacter magdeburgensis]|uniref:Uncharacterized protein n=1 Tax=Helicobacter magdeburgensis TaxID=471858 RepID=A0A4U8T2Y3_9HELI|nr:hypothetical protein [Helicobacter magdeburgensis]TLD93805.1 hypothetical protein LS74_000170 [Helicobacter magdeburgensis]